MLPAWAAHVREIAAFQCGITSAIAKGVAAEVALDGNVTKDADGGGEIPAVHNQPLRGRTGARIRRQIKVEVRVAAEYLDLGNVLGGSDAEKKESCQSDANQFIHVSYCASRECKNWHNRPTTGSNWQPGSDRASLSRNGAPSWSGPLCTSTLTQDYGERRL